MKTTMTTGNLAKFLELLDQKDMTPERFQFLLGTGVFADIFDSSATFADRDLWRNAFGLGKLVPDVIILPIDYTKSLEQMIVAGNYDWKNDELTAKRFPIVGEGVVEYEFRYFHFNRNVSSETAVDLIKKEDSENPWEPAKTEHLLAFGEKFPEEQRKFPIVALGSVGEVRGIRCVPVLNEGGSGRDLYLDWWGGVWDGRCRFLAVRKVSRTSVS
jgi:hypothetical protein